jgi:hypothetical protein
MLTSDDDLRDAVAQQARRTYAYQQLARYRAGIQHWCERMESTPSDVNTEYGEFLLDYYGRQVKHWEDYLEDLG